MPVSLPFVNSVQFYSYLLTCNKPSSTTPPPPKKKKSLTLIVNHVLHTGIFPSQLKTSRVKPVHERGEQSSFCNYRPMSLSPSMSKVFEYVIFNQLMSFLTDNQIFCMEQFSFRPGHSTELVA